MEDVEEGVGQDAEVAVPSLPPLSWVEALKGWCDTERGQVFDYSELRKDPTMSAWLDHHEAYMIIVKSSDMMDQVRPDFESRGWVYAATGYGEGKTGLNVVIDNDNKVVQPQKVRDALGALKVLYEVNYRGSGEARA